MQSRCLLAGPLTDISTVGFSCEVRPHRQGLQIIIVHGHVPLQALERSQVVRQLDRLLAIPAGVLRVSGVLLGLLFGDDVRVRICTYFLILLVFGLHLDIRSIFVCPLAWRVLERGSAAILNVAEPMADHLGLLLPILAAFAFDEAGAASFARTDLVFQTAACLVAEVKPDGASNQQEEKNDDHRGDGTTRATFRFRRRSRKALPFFLSFRLFRGKPGLLLSLLLLEPQSLLLCLDLVREALCFGHFVPIAALDINGDKSQASQHVEVLLNRLRLEAVEPIHVLVVRVVVEEWRLIRAFILAERWHDGHAAGRILHNAYLRNGRRGAIELKAADVLAFAEFKHFTCDVRILTANFENSSMG